MQVVAGKQQDALRRAHEGSSCRSPLHRGATLSLGGICACVPPARQPPANRGGNCHRGDPGYAAGS